MDKEEQDFKEYVKQKLNNIESVSKSILAVSILLFVFYLIFNVIRI
jgi:hypothetical protein